MSVDKFDPNQPVVTVTDKAVQHMKKQLIGHSGKSIRVSVKKSGCTGYSYVLDIAEHPEDGDVILETKEDFYIYLSKEAAPMLVGTEIDIKIQGLNKELQFNNPNVTDTCGCGSSFNVG